LGGALVPRGGLFGATLGVLRGLFAPAHGLGGFVGSALGRFGGFLGFFSCLLATAYVALDLSRLGIQFTRLDHGFGVIFLGLILARGDQESLPATCLGFFEFGCRLSLLLVRSFFQCARLIGELLGFFRRN